MLYALTGKLVFVNYNVCSVQMCVHFYVYVVKLQSFRRVWPQPPQPPYKLSEKLFFFVKKQIFFSSKNIRQIKIYFPLK